MKTFKASQGLVDLLVKYGFTDHTEKLYPEHFRRIKAVGYDPYCMKRIFSFNQHNDYLLFHYTYITLHHNGNFNHTEERRMLSEDELRSLITFYKLPAENGKEWLEAYTNALELHKYYRNICAMPEVFNSGIDRRIKETYEHVVIS